MEKLTNKQKKVLDFIRAQIRRAVPPTIREIAQHMGFSSTGTVRDYLRALEKKGYLTKGGNMARSIELSDKSFKIPILGSIPAGRPATAYENIEGYVDANDLYLGRLCLDDVFALRVKGDSMIEAGIMDGDIAIIKKQPVAEHDDVVAALLDGSEVTLKRLKHKDRHYHLEPANKDYPPIFEQFTIIGRLVAVVRKYQ
jgi:repressor LexA